ncbi:MAG TPA: nuclear transport factor 2 family protein [Chthoniobacterales bacterium]|nr:nuclear transport factor 2 family protein [Chthoniobacterales bacterium]
MYDKGMVSVEARRNDGSSPEAHGIKGVREKVDWWANKMEVHSFERSGPFVAHDRSVVRYDIDVTGKDSKKRRRMSEVYAVNDGKIEREEFLPLVKS